MTKEFLKALFQSIFFFGGLILIFAVLSIDDLWEAGIQFFIGCVCIAIASIVPKG